MKSNEPSFHRSVTIVALLHLGFLALIIYLVKPPKKTGETVTWVETGSFAMPAGGENSSPKQEEASSEEETSLPSEPEKISPPEQPPEETPQEIAEPVVTPEPTTPVPEPAPTPPPAIDSEIPIAAPPKPITPPDPTPKEQPQPTPKEAPKPTPKPKPKTKPKPKPKPAPKPLPKPKEKEEETPKPTPKPKPKTSSSAHKTATSSTTHKKSTPTKTSSGKQGNADHGDENLKKAFLNSKGGTGHGEEGSGTGSGKNGNGVNANVLAGYHELIHDRFYSQWEQPTAIPTEHRHDFVCTLRLTIERDGTISNFSLAKPSGNPVMDESVLAAAAKVKQIAPLPEGLSQSAPYTVNINFELE